MLLRGALYHCHHRSNHQLFFFGSLRRRLSSSSSPPPAVITACHLWISKTLATAFIHLPVSRLTQFNNIIKITPLIAFEAARRLPGTDPVLDFFKFSKSELGLVHSAAMHRYTITLLMKCGKFDDALKVFDEMCDCGYLPDGSFLELVVDFLVQDGNLDGAIKLLRRCSEFECKVRAYSLNNLLSLLVARNRARDAVGLFSEQLGSPFFIVDTCSFNIVMKGLCRLREFDKAFELFWRMGSYECMPDTVTHNTLVDGLCRADKVDGGRELLRRIQSDGMCVPNVVTFTALISGYCKAGKMDEAFGVFSEMIECGIKPSRVTYNVLIDGYGKYGDMHEAVSMYERMMVCGCPPDVVTFTSLIDGYCRSGQINEAMTRWSEMVDRNIRPNAYTFAVMITALCKKNQVRDAQDLLNNMNRRRDILPRAFIYNPVIDALCKAGNVDEANLTLRQMEERRCTDKYTYTILIIGHCMKGRIAEAITLFEKMAAAGCVPDSVTIGSLRTCLLKSGMPNEAERIVHFHQ